MMRNALFITLMVVFITFGSGPGEGQDTPPDDDITFFESVFAAVDDYIRLLHLNWQTNLAWAYFQQGQQEEALMLMDQVVQTTEDYPMIYHVAALAQRAKLYALIFDYDAAVDDMNVAIDLKPNIPELYALRGQYILLTYEWDQVLADYNQAIDLDPDYADAYFLRGVLFYTQGPREDALDDFEHYLELAPDGLYAEEAANYNDLLRVEFATLDD